MKMFCGTLIGIAALLIVAPLAGAGPPSWDDQINKPSRFKVLKEFNDEAVFDKETGLVWEQSPDTTLNDGGVIPHFICNLKTVGGRRGWRLPTVQELASLVDPTQFNPALPSGHPFSNVQLSIFYWSATAVADTSIGPLAWIVGFQNGGVGFVDKTTSLAYVWCVRGGQGVDPQ